MEGRCCPWMYYLCHQYRTQRSGGEKNNRLLSPCRSEKHCRTPQNIKQYGQRWREAGRNGMTLESRAACIFPLKSLNQWGSELGPSPVLLSVCLSGCLSRVEAVRSAVILGCSFRRGPAALPWEGTVPIKEAEGSQSATTAALPLPLSSKLPFSLSLPLSHPTDNRYRDLKRRGKLKTDIRSGWKWVCVCCVDGWVLQCVEEA